MKQTTKKEDLLEWMPYGTVKRVAKEMNIDYSTLRRAVRAQAPKLKYIVAVQKCYTLALENKEEQEKLSDFKNQLS